MLSRLSIRSILFLCIGLLVMLISVQGYIGFKGLGQVEANLNYATSNTIPSLDQLGRIHARANAIQAQLGRHILAATVEDTRVHDVALRKQIEDMEQDLRSYEKLVSDEKERAIFDGVQQSWARWKPEIDNVTALSLALRTPEATHDFNTRQEKPASEMIATLEKDLAYNSQLAVTARKRSDEVAKNARTVLTIALLCALALSAAAALMIVLRVTRPISRLTDSMNDMAGGDFDIAIPFTDKGDEIGSIARALGNIRSGIAERAQREAEEQMATQELIVTSIGNGLEALREGKLYFRLNDAFPADYDRLRTDLNQALAELEVIISGVVETAQTVDGASTEILTATNDLSDRTERQAASLEETAASVNELTHGVSEAAEAARAARELAGTANQEAAQGQHVVERAMASMNAIAASSSRMEAIVGLIDGLAFQTNLLALNAGIEAARAGDAGSGFAVVANEVRVLAQRSADAALDIKTLIGESTTQVGSGVALVNETGASLSRIREGATQVFDLVDQIAETSADQSASIEQVNAVVRDMDKITQQNAALVEETVAAMRNMGEHAELLASRVSRFVLSADKTTGNRNTAPAPDRASPGKPRVSARSAATVGNLALKQDEPQDWSEF